MTDSADGFGTATIEVIPVGSSADLCEGAVISLSLGEGESEVRVSSGLGPEQCREVARRLLTIADAASRGSTRTTLCVSAEHMWRLPGQTLLVRYDADGRLQCEFAVRAPQAGPVVRPQRRGLMKVRDRLIYPGSSGR